MPNPKNKKKKHEAIPEILKFLTRVKAKAMQIVQTESIYQKALQQLGREWGHTEKLFEKLEAFTCVLCVRFIEVWK